MYRLRAGESLEDAAWALFGDRRLTHQLTVIHGIAYVKDAERQGPPSKWAAAPTQRKERNEQHPASAGPSKEQR